MALDPADCIAIVIAIGVVFIGALGTVGYMSHRKADKDILSTP